MSHRSTRDIIDRLENSDTNYIEVLDVDTLRVELAQYPNPEPKYPHDEDELYYIITGSGLASVGTEEFAISAGDLVFVEQGVEHAFHDIEEEITALIIFAGAEESVLDRPSSSN